MGEESCVAFFATSYIFLICEFVEIKSFS